MNTLRLMHACACAAFLCAASVASAIDSASFELGAGEHVSLTRVGLQSHWNKRWWQRNGAHLTGYWDTTIAHWRGTRFQGRPGATQRLTVVGLTPVFRYQRDSGQGFYVEAAIGLHLLSGLYDDGNRQLSTRFQFGDHLALGYVFANRTDLKLKLQHFSNGGIKEPNDGVNFIVFSLSRDF